jgi:hypothetical protein
MKLFSYNDVLSVIPLDLWHDMAKIYQGDYFSSVDGFYHGCRVLDNALMLIDQDGGCLTTAILHAFFHDLYIEHGQTNWTQDASSLLFQWREKLNATDKAVEDTMKICETMAGNVQSRQPWMSVYFDASTLDDFRHEIILTPEKLLSRTAKISYIIVLCNKKSVSKKYPDWINDLRDSIMVD